MPNQPSLLKSVIKKGLAGVIIGAILAVLAKALEFPPVFQTMFFLYALLGAVVYLLLDAPAVQPVSGVKAIIALVVFYAVISGVYIGGASLLPQYDPEDEKGKIEKLLKPKRAATEQGKAEELLARTQALSEKAEAIMKRLQAAGVGGTGEATPEAGGAKAMAGAATGDVVAMGRQQWDLQECYNCHKLEGKGGKKRGPELDNIGSLMTPEQLRQKVIDPQSWMAEGFEKEFEKKKMPGKYRELMEDKEIDALVAFLTTLKNTSVSTPKPIQKKP
jgi:mono/diheme cytochrome c family protein